MMRPSVLASGAGLCLIGILISGGTFQVYADQNGPDIMNESDILLYRTAIQSLNMTNSIPFDVNDSIVLEPVYPGGEGYSCTCSPDPDSTPPNRCTDTPSYDITLPGSYILGADTGNRDCAIIIHASQVFLNGNNQSSSGITISSGASDAMVKNFGAITGDGLTSFANNTSLMNDNVFQVNNQGISVYGSNSILINNTVTTSQNTLQE
jgi:hypothetical protein